MINADPPGDDADAAKPEDAAVSAILRTGAPGAIALAGIATAVVVAIWVAFYLLVFVPYASGS